MCKPEVNQKVNVKKILVSQPQPSSEKSPYYDIATRYGVEVVFRPFIKVEGLSAREFRQQKINIGDFTAIIFTARTGDIDTHLFTQLSTISSACVKRCVSISPTR